MRVETDRLLLRPVEASDAAALLAMWSDPDVTRYMGGPRDPERVRQAIEEEARTGAPYPMGLWPVVEKASGRVIGDCGLLEKEVGGRVEVELVYVFAADSWGKGYATEAASAVRDYAFHSLRLIRIIALINPDNVASARVAEKAGLTFERETLRPSGTVRRLFSMHADVPLGEEQRQWTKRPFKTTTPMN